LRQKISLSHISNPIYHSKIKLFSNKGYGQLGSDTCDPNTEEWVGQLYSSGEKKHKLIERNSVQSRTSKTLDRKV